MEITWYGHSCVRIAERSMPSVVCDPYDHNQVGYSPLKLKAEIVTMSHNLPGHNYIKSVKGEPFIVNGPGEYEIGDVFVTAIQTNGSKRHSGEPRNLLCVIDVNGITVAHLGAMKHTPTQTQVEALGSVNIALVPVGGGDGLNAANAAEVISMLEPNIVVPIHYNVNESELGLDPLSKFLKAMGLTSPETEDTLKVTSSTSLPEETKVIVLNCKST